MRSRSCSALLLLALCNAAASAPRIYGAARCANVWDEGCVNGQLPGAGRDDEFVNGDSSPGKRCAPAPGGGCGAPPLQAAVPELRSRGAAPRSAGPVAEAPGDAYASARARLRAALWAALLEGA